MKETYKNVVKDLSLAAHPSKAKVMQRFFKTGKGEYGEGDIFLGVTVPEQRKIAKRYRELPLSSIQKLLESGVHEHRLTALLILVNQFERATQEDKGKVFNFYIDHRRWVNNWDLVDTSAPAIVGAYLCNDRSCLLLKKLVRSKSMWDRRIAMVSTYVMIRQSRFDMTISLAEILLTDAHDLIQKAVGWMLREAGKRDGTVLKTFLDRYSQVMPRTMLRYAIERLTVDERAFYMAKKTAL